VLPVAGDPGPRLAAHDPVEIGELLQLLLLTDSRTAAKTLAWAAGPSIGRTLTRMQQAAARLGLKHTAPADDWPFGTGVNASGTTGRRGATTVRELGRLTLALLSEAEIRRRIALDGVPISNGGLIVRATSPLIALQSDAATTPAVESATSPDVRIALAERDNLSLLAVVAAPRPDETLVATLDRGFHRYRRVEVVREGQAVGPTVHVRGGIIPSFNAVAAEPWALTTKESKASPLSFRLQLPKQIDAPVEVHQPLGELVVERDGRVLAVVPLVAPRAIAPSGWLDTAHQ
jgi:D-alanyl-D-alanine carboxypeptidase